MVRYDAILPKWADSGFTLSAFVGGAEKDANYGAVAPLQ